MTAFGRGVILAVLAFSSACASLGSLSRLIQPPRFSEAENQPAEIRLVGPAAGRPLGGAMVRIWTRVSNPNPFGFRLSTLETTLLLDGSRAATGDFPLGLPLRAGEESVIPLDLSISFSDMAGLSSVVRNAIGGQRVGYQLDGTIGIDAGALGQPTFGPMVLFRGELSARRDPRSSLDRSGASTSPSQASRSIEDVAKQALDPHDSVCDATLMPSSFGQPATILASVDSSGRHFCNTIVRIRIADKPSVVWETGAWNAENVSSLIKDVDGDGTLELVIPQSFTNYEGSWACEAVVPVVFRCSTVTCSDASSSFSGFYAAELDALGSRIALAENASIGDQQAELLPCLTMGRDRIRRMLGMDPRAGFQQAEAWMRSSNLYLRRKAAVVFADIGDSTSRQRLETLAKDPDRGVADLASRALAPK